MAWEIPTRGLLSLIRMIALLLARAAVSAALLHAAPRMPLRAPRAVMRADVPQTAQVLPPYVQYATEGRVGFTSVAVCALALSNLVVQLTRPSRSFATARWLFLRAFSVVACAAFRVFVLCCQYFGSQKETHVCIHPESLRATNK